MVIQLHQLSDGHNLSHPREIPLRHKTFYLQKGEKKITLHVQIYLQNLLLDFGTLYLVLKLSFFLIFELSSYVQKFNLTLSKRTAISRARVL